LAYLLQKYFYNPDSNFNKLKPESFKHLSLPHMQGAGYAATVYYGKCPATLQMQQNRLFRRADNQVSGKK
jgi:hypothetical protein